MYEMEGRLNTVSGLMMLPALSMFVRCCKRHRNASGLGITGPFNFIFANQVGDVQVPKVVVSFIWFANNLGKGGQKCTLSKFSSTLKLDRIKRA